jgi:uncharacterized repeat protein (TIGR01451 family)
MLPTSNKQQSEYKIDRTTNKGGIIMMATKTLTLMALLVLVSAQSAFAYQNTAVNDAAGSFVLQDSTPVDITAGAAITLMKAVYNGPTCIASSNTLCGGGLTATTPAGTELTFVIYVYNSSAITLYDVRFNDVLNAGYTYVTGSMTWGQQVIAESWANALTTANLNTGATEAPDAGDPLSEAAGTISSGGNGAANATVDIPTGEMFAISFKATIN